VAAPADDASIAEWAEMSAADMSAIVLPDLSTAVPDISAAALPEATAPLPEPVVEALPEAFARTSILGLTWPDLTRQPHDQPATDRLHAGAGSVKSALELDLTALFDEAAEETAAARSEDEGPTVYELDSTALDLSMVGLDAALTARVVAIGNRDDDGDEPGPEPSRLSETELYAPLPWMAVRWPTLETHVVESRVPVGAEQIKRGDFEEPKEWLDIIEALRRDAQQMKFARSGAAPGEIQPAGPTPGSAEAAPKKKRRSPGNPVNPVQRNPGAPVQDEWGFFDPQKCGFAALLAKLEEITDQEDGPPRRGA
jgi:hypothetical protein